VNQTVSILNLLVAAGVVISLLASAIALFVTRFEHRDTLRRMGRLEDQYDDLRRGKGFISEDDR